MNRKQKITVLERLVGRGEIFCAEVLADDWNLRSVLDRIVNGTI